MKRTSKDEKLILNVFANTNNFCWLCGISEGKLDQGSSWAGCMDYRRLEIHHISKLGRKHEGWNLSRLCKMCHMIVEGHSVRRGNGEYYPKVSNEHVFHLKKFMDAKHFDFEAIVSSWRNGRPEKPAMPHTDYAEQYKRNRGKFPAWFER